MASTTDVGNAIPAIQNSASQSMAQMDTSVKFIEEATEYANQSGAALREVVSMVDQTADQVRAGRLLSLLEDIFKLVVAQMPGSGVAHLRPGCPVLGAEFSVCNSNAVQEEESICGVRERPWCLISLLKKSRLTFSRRFSENMVSLNPRKN